MKKQTLFLYSYSALLLIGGFIGFLVKGSMGSIIAGGICSLLMAVSICKMQKGSTAGYWCACMLTAILTVFFSYRLWITDAFMPSGLMMAISCLAMVSLYPGCKRKSCAG